MFLMRSREASQELVKLVLQLASTALQDLDSREGGLKIKLFDRNCLEINQINIYLRKERLIREETGGECLHRSAVLFDVQIKFLLKKYFVEN